MLFVGMSSRAVCERCEREGESEREREGGKRMQESVRAKAGEKHVT
jgi:hypothetical protein